MDQELQEYRSFLVGAEQAAQEQYDKTVLTLSGGAFGISFAFVDKLVSSDPVATGWLLWAWGAWGVSITAVLFSFYFSTKALRKSIEQVDDGEIRGNTPGGYHTSITQGLNITGGVLFLVGAILLVVFVSRNI